MRDKSEDGIMLSNDTKKNIEFGLTRGLLLVLAVAPAILLLISYLTPTAVSGNNLQLTFSGIVAIFLFPYVIIFTPLCLACYTNFQSFPYRSLQVFIVWTIATYAALIYQMYGGVISINSTIPFVLGFSVFIIGGLILFLLVFAPVRSKIKAQDLASNSK